MPVRAALNVVYAMATHDMDTKQRKEYDAALYGWDDQNEAANSALFANLNAPDDESGGESR
jgi:hypothetical protein